MGLLLKLAILVSLESSSSDFSVISPLMSSSSFSRPSQRHNTCFIFHYYFYVIMSFTFSQIRSTCCSHSTASHLWFSPASPVSHSVAASLVLLFHLGGPKFEILTKKELELNSSPMFSNTGATTSYRHHHHDSLSLVFSPFSFWISEIKRLRLSWRAAGMIHLTPWFYVSTQFNGSLNMKSNLGVTHLKC